MQRCRERNPTSSSMAGGALGKGQGGAAVSQTSAAANRYLGFCQETENPLGSGVGFVMLCSFFELA